MKRIALLSATVALCTALSAQDVTWSEDIAPILYDHCTSCHREGEIGPFPITSYEEATAYGGMIEYVTAIKYMPPWSPNPEYVHFKDENVLTEEEIALIGDWYADGMPQGDPALEPPVPTFPEGSQVGEPDLVLTMEEAYLHEGDNTDQYQVFVLETGLTEDVDISAIEVRPDNKNICHHAILAVDTTNTANILDNADPDYGYEEFGGFGFDPTIGFWGSWVPGMQPQVYPPTIGNRLWADSKILLQMHYGPYPVDEYDQTSINIFFADDPVQRYVFTFPVSPEDLDEPFLIPPNEITTFHGIFQTPFDVSVIGIAPHCHLLGKSWEVFAVSPDETDTIPLIDIPEWDFNWQGFYTYPNLLHIPSGYNIHAFGTYDNTSDNPFNPSDPPQWSWWGEGTQDEMFLCYFSIIPYQEGDEDISLAVADDQLHMVYPEDELFPSYPNPSSTEVTVGFSLVSSRAVSLDLMDNNGRLVRSLLTESHLAPGYHRHRFNVDDLPSGVYHYRLHYSGFDQCHQMVIGQ